MKKILFLSTGGTIASQEGENGLKPALTAQDLLYAVPELKDLCELEAEELFQLDSTNVSPKEWLMLAQEIRKQYDAYDGFVIAHGTDTMAYTAAALSYLIQYSAKPIVLTGSQKSMCESDTDARKNMLRAFHYAVSDQAWGIQIVFYDKVILGTRASKSYSKSFHAFASVNYPETASFRDMQLIQYLPKPQMPETTFFYHLEQRVFVLKLIPGMQVEVLWEVLPYCRGLIIEGFGLGGLPTTQHWLEVLRPWLEQGGVAVFATQVRNEGTDLSVYEVGQLAGQLPGTTEALDMTTEAAVTKLMWALAEGSDQQEVCRLFETPILFDRTI